LTDISLLNDFLMRIPISKLLFVLPFLIAPLLASMASQAAAAEAELSKVTLFVEGMMKSRGGVT
jgi:hypothetical protein